MFEEIMERLEGIPATIVSGVCLLASLFLPMVLEQELPIYLDPAWISVIISGVPLVVSAVKKLIFKKGITRISSALLISIAMIAAIAIGDLFAAGEVAFIMAIGEILEDMTTDRAKKGLRKLIGLAPTEARIICDGEEKTVRAEEVKVGDIVRILPGETVAVDGVITEGQTSIDQSVMTGESLPCEKTVGDTVYSGTVNCFGSIDIRATKVGEDSSLQKLIRMVKEAEDKKAPMQRAADKWAGWLVPAALLIAVVSGILLQNITVAVTVLVVFCPCALVLATPTAIMAAIGQATKHGVIIKSGEALETMGKVDTVAFDKTGTLTYGRLRVSDVVAAGDGDKEKLLAMIASAESRSEHPLGKAIVAYAKEHGIQLYEAQDFSMEAGKGIVATVDGRRILCGNARFIRESGIDAGAAQKDIDRLLAEGKATVIAAADGEVLGIVALSDELRPEASGVVKRLEADGTKTVLLTGDTKAAAEYAVGGTGISEIRAELLPEQKVENVRELCEQGRTVCMIGDGVNDAPALKAANVGVAMGAMGSDIAIEAADIALMSDDISKLPYIKRLAKATVNTIRFGITLSLCINFVAIVLSILGWLTPTTGALVHNAGSVLVVLIAALLYDRKFDK